MTRTKYRTGMSRTERHTPRTLPPCRFNQARGTRASITTTSSTRPPCRATVCRAALSLRPSLFAAVVAEVPFVDVVNTMHDETLPLTVTEWEEWGDPRDPVYEAYMASYAPYENVRAADGPALFVTAGLNDPRVSFHEPAKWMAKLRATATGERPLLLRTELGMGHSGPSGRYDAWREEARALSFLLTVLPRP